MLTKIFTIHCTKRKKKDGNLQNKIYNATEICTFGYKKVKIISLIDKNNSKKNASGANA